MMNIKQTEAAIEAILFASGEPISVKRLADTVEVEEETVYKICKTLQDRKKTDESRSEEHTSESSHLKLSRMPSSA